MCAQYIHLSTIFYRLKPDFHVLACVCVYVCVCVWLEGGGGRDQANQTMLFTDLLQNITSLDLIHFGVKHDFSSYKERWT